MTRNPRPTIILDSLGEEIVRIITPVSICMLLVVTLVSVLTSSSDSSAARASIATVAYSETSSDSTWDKLLGALLNSLVFVVVVTAVTFLLVLLFYLRCTGFLRFYMGFSAFTVLGFLGGETALLLVQRFDVPIDLITFGIFLFNFSVVGVLAVFMSKMAISVTQSYLVAIGMLVAYWFTLLPEWTTWTLLVAMSLYDLAAVLLPVGPLRLLVELAISRDEDIPALVYEARPITAPNSSRGETRGLVGDSGSSLVAPLLDRSGPGGESSGLAGVAVPAMARGDSGAVEIVNGSGENIVQRRVWRDGSGAVSDDPMESMGLGSSGAIKLGLGDFIFYSVLVGRAAMYDLTTVYACYLAIVAGLGVTLLLLALFRQALPALPVSVMLGVLFYFLTRFLLEPFIVQCSLNLVMF